MSLNLILAKFHWHTGGGLERSPDPIEIYHSRQQLSKDNSKLSRDGINMIILRGRVGRWRQPFWFERIPEIFYKESGSSNGTMMLVALTTDVT